LEQEQQKLSNENTIKEIRQDYDIDYRTKLLEVDRMHDDKTLRKYQIDTMERIFKQLGVKDVRINQFVGGVDGHNDLAAILPSLGYTMNQLKTA